MSGLIEEPKEKGLYDGKAVELIDEISKFIAFSRDQWMCSDCLLDGGYDSPADVLPCPEGCYRSYCDKCREKRKDTCKCKGDLSCE